MWGAVSLATVLECGAPLPAFICNATSQPATSFSAQPNPTHPHTPYLHPPLTSCDNITIAPPLLKELEACADPLPYKLWPRMVRLPTVAMLF